MSGAAAYSARLREKRRATGMKETTIWLKPEDEDVVAALLEHKGLRNRSEAIQYALSRVSLEEPKLEA